jgi:Ca2+-binding RTX toxin-like protein
MEIDNGKVANHFVGNGGNDTILSEGGNDTIEGGAGDDSIDGGDGSQDVAIFYSKKENYQITRNPDAEGVDQITVRYVGNGENGEIDEGTDSLTNIELLQFADFDENNPIHTDSITITGLPS